jgi:hypothetical protein
MKTSLLRRVLLSIVSAGLLSILGTSAGAQTPTAPPAPTISDLSWLAGDWQTAPGGRSQTDEHWTHPAGASMLGLSRTVAGGRTHEFEYLRIEQRQDGIYYVAHPKARCPATDFKLTRMTATEVVFENPAHDFPKRITYRKTAEGSIIASVAGGVGTKGSTFTYLPMKRQ